MYLSIIWRDAEEKDGLKSEINLSDSRFIQLGFSLFKIGYLKHVLILSTELAKARATFLAKNDTIKNESSVKKVAKKKTAKKKALSLEDKQVLVYKYNLPSGWKIIDTKARSFKVMYDEKGRKRAEVYLTELKLKNNEKLCYCMQILFNNRYKVVTDIKNQRVYINDNGDDKIVREWKAAIGENLQSLWEIANDVMIEMFPKFENVVAYWSND